MTAAKRIAHAIAKTGVYHKRTAVLAGLIALGCCIVVIVFDGPFEKGVALTFAVIFGVAAFRSLRRANLYFDIEGSPVLEAITQAPQRIARIEPIKEGSEPSVRVTDEHGNALVLRASDDAGQQELLDALRAHAPGSEVRGKAHVESSASTGDGEVPDEEDTPSEGPPASGAGRSQSDPESEDETERDVSPAPRAVSSRSEPPASRGDDEPVPPSGPRSSTERSPGG